MLWPDVAMILFMTSVMSAFEYGLRGVGSVYGKVWISLESVDRFWSMVAP